LVVAQTPSLVTALLSHLDSSSYDVTVVRGFAAGKTHLDLEPDLLLTELRLGEYNGLHLALRAGAARIPAAVIGEPDTVLERDAAKLGASYIQTGELSRDYLVGFVSTLLSQADVTGRNRIAWLRAERGHRMRVAGRA
jgi:DNA-binding response OmpR family regulator